LVRTKQISDNLTITVDNGVKPLDITFNNVNYYKFIMFPVINVCVSGVCIKYCPDDYFATADDFCLQQTFMTSSCYLWDHIGMQFFPCNQTYFNYTNILNNTADINSIMTLRSL
jgi:hypothetical protein